MMGYVDRIIQPGEEVLSIGRMHWIVYLRGTLMCLFGLALVFLVPGVIDVPALEFAAILIGGILIAYGVFALIASWIEAWTTEIAVTNKRVIHKRGLIRRETGEMNMEKVESVVVDQTIPGRILNYGSIVVRGTGAGIEGLHHIANPLEVRSAIVVR
jgi:uncharacterized membrane protein YdbT with pleckstrin-like domain